MARELAIGADAAFATDSLGLMTGAGPAPAGGESLVTGLLGLPEIPELLAGRVTGMEGVFLISGALSILFGFVIGYERERRGKEAGVSTHAFVVLGACLFTMLSELLDPASPARIAAQVVTGIGFLGAGIILKDGAGRLVNLTTAADIWLCAALGMALGARLYLLATLALLLVFVILRAFPPIKERVARARSRESDADVGGRQASPSQPGEPREPRAGAGDTREDL